MGELERVPFSIIDRVESAVAHIRQMMTVGDLQDVRASIAAAREWAKVQRRLGEVQADLLRLEVEALARIASLDVKALPSSYRKPAAWLASLTEAEREAFCAEASPLTSAVSAVAGMLARQRQEAAAADGRRFAHHPEPPQHSNAPDISSIANDLLDNLTEEGETFTIDEMVQSVLHAIGSERVSDHAWLEGLAEVCRQIVRSSSPVLIDGTVMPKTLTVESEPGVWVRMSATVEHALADLEMRRDQLAAMQAAFDKRSRFVEILNDLSRGDDAAVIGDLVRTSAQGDAA